MQYLKTHYGRAINVIPSETINIPNPANAGLSSITTDGDTNLLIDTSVTFTTNMMGNIVVANGAIATVTGFTDEHTLVLSADITPSDAISYTLYVPTPNEGCSIYFKERGNITVLTVGGDVVTFKKCGDANASMILPVQVLRVISTELTDLIALW